MKDSCKKIDGFIYELPKKKLKEDGKNRLAKHKIGDGTGSGEGKVQMVVGATGAGEEHLISASSCT